MRVNKKWLEWWWKSEALGSNFSFDEHFFKLL